MKFFNAPARVASILLVVVGAGLLALNIFLGGVINIALPLVFLMLGGMFFIFAMGAESERPWTSLLYVPGGLLLALGLIFLINILTQDWNSWAYAWLLFVVGMGIGLILANRRGIWPHVVTLVGWGMAAAGVTFFAVFGAIAGGLFIQVMAPILLILGGLTLYWLHPETLFKKQFRGPVGASPQSPAIQNQADSAQSQLVEPLSTREIEVLRLVDEGYSNQQIADKLSIAGSTVKTHINNIYGKLGVQTRVQAVHRARELGLLVWLTMILSLTLLTGCTASDIPIGHRWASVQGGSIEQAAAGEEFFFEVPVDKSLFEPVVIPIEIKLSGMVNSGGVRFELRQPDGQVVWNSGDIGPGDFSIAVEHVPDRAVTGMYHLGLVWQANTSAQYDLSWKSFRLGAGVFLPGAGMLLVALGFIFYLIRQRLSWRYWGLGALFWVITVSLKFAFAVPVNPFVYQLLNVSYANAFEPVNWIAYVYIGLLTGIFEAGVAYLILKKIRWGKATWGQALAFGIGFGAIEAILLAFASLGSAAAAVLAPDALPAPTLGNLAQSSTLLMGLAPVVERLMVIIAHVFACVMIFHAIATGEAKWAWLAVLYKTVLDTPAAFAAFWGVSTPGRMWTIEGLVALVALVGLWGITVIARRYPREAPDAAPVEESPVNPVS